MGLATFSLDVNADRPPVITVNGQPIAGVVAYTVRHVPPAMPQLILELTGEIDIAGEGIVGVGPEQNEVEYLRTFLVNLDPEKLDEAAANKFGTDDRQGRVITNPGKAFVEAILDAVEGSR